MRAIEITQPGGPEVLKPTERPVPEIGADQVRIQVVTAGVNRPDCLQRTGSYPVPKGASDLPGLEVSGYIDAVGADVTGFAVGDAVVALTAGGGYADYVSVHAGAVLPAPRGLDLADAGGLMECAMTVWINLFERGHAKSGETLLVHGGSSGIGAAAIQLAKAFGLKVVTTVGSAEKAAFARDMGADWVINYREEDFVTVVKDYTDGHGVDLVLDMVGGDYIPRNIAVLADDGRHLTIALLRGAQAEVNMGHILRRRLTLTGSTLRPRTDAVKAATAQALLVHVWPLIEAGQYRVPIDSRFALAEANQAHARMEEGHHKGKILLQVRSG